MPTYTAASSHDHRQPQRTGILVVQLGTPEAAEPGAVRKYLAQFLSDPRVVEIPRHVWLPILHGIILRKRPASSAAKYAAIWTDKGSPLMVHTRAQALLLRGALGAAGHDVDVEYAMRYGSPSIGDVLRKMRERNLERLLVLPMYPQYSASTTATAFDEVFRELALWRNPPELRTIKHFHDWPGYIDALAERIRKTWTVDGRPDKLVMSFHGVPKRTLTLGDPYHCECLVTGRLLAQRLELRDEDWVVTFQSRFGKAEWLQPYTDATLQSLGKAGAKRVDVVCPGFVADCLETLEEIAMEGRDTFLAAGGQQFNYIPCLNDSSQLIRGLVSLVQTHLSGWPTRKLSADAERDAEAALERRQKRAQAIGAPR